MKSIRSIRTARTNIRRFVDSDIDHFTDLLCDKSATQNMAFPAEIKTEQGAADLLKATIKAYDTDQPLFAYAIEDIKKGNFLGVAGFNILKEKEIEVFYALLPKYWGNGYATEVLKKLIYYVFQNTNYSIIVAPITQKNLASIRVAEKNGFLNHGLVKDSKYNDLVFIYKRKKSD